VSTLAFLLEIGAEEIPDWMIVPALENLRELFGSLGVGNVSRVDATPRRLVLWADLVERQADAEELVTGPPKSAGAGAANGFAKKMGVTVDQLGTESTAKGEYFSFVKKIPGRATVEILSEKLPEIIAKIQWPKTMLWTIPGVPAKASPRFIRPIRWIVALLGDNVVPFRYGDVNSGAVTQGHRILGLGVIPVSIATYEEELRRNFVTVAAAERRVRIENAIDGKHVKADPKLLDTLTYITEFPTAIEGTFDPEYLKLPKEVLVTVMRHHQKYFSVEDENGELAPKFIAVMNTNGDPDGLVRKGNERVLRARFNDARFFWEVDRRRTLEVRSPDLIAVTFQTSLGTYEKKTIGTAKSAKRIATLLGLDPASAETAAKLCKIDLMTEMVKEFTDLQGIVGGLYLRDEGQPEEVWRAVYEHYRPLSMEAPIPPSKYGQVLSVADKLDTIVGCFGKGIIPSGSKDPLGLRRAAQGIVRVIVEGGLALNLREIVREEASANTEVFGDDQDYLYRNSDGAGLAKAVVDFLSDRVRYYFRDIRGFAYDEVNAVMAAGWDSLPDVEARLTRISKIRPTADFEPLAASFKRVKNILSQANITAAPTVDSGLIEPGPERELFDEFQRVSGEPIEKAISSLRPKLDTFFDKVLVNVPDEKVRQNRLTLLSQVLNEFSTIADFSEIVTSKES